VPILKARGHDQQQGRGLEVQFATSNRWQDAPVFFDLAHNWQA